MISRFLLGKKAPPKQHRRVNWWVRMEVYQKLSRFYLGEASCVMAMLLGLFIIMNPSPELVTALVIPLVLLAFLGIGILAYKRVRYSKVIWYLKRGVIAQGSLIELHHERTWWGGRQQRIVCSYVVKGQLVDASIISPHHKDMVVAKSIVVLHDPEFPHLAIVPFSWSKLIVDELAMINSGKQLS